MSFDFHEASEEQRTERRNNRAWCVERLHACTSLARHLATAQGIYTPLSQREEDLLQDFHRVQDAFAVCLVSMMECLTSFATMQDYSRVM